MEPNGVDEPRRRRGSQLIASIYLGSALAFALYSMISHPDLYEHVQAEADALFGNGYPGKEEFTMSAIDVTHRMIMESHRLYPIIPVTIRHVMNPIVFEGYQIPVGSRRAWRGCRDPAGGATERLICQRVVRDTTRPLRPGECYE